MKKQILIVISAITCLLSACSTSNFAYYDDIYSSTGEKKAQTGNVAATTGKNMSATPTVEADSIIYETDENGNLLRTLTYYPGSSEPVITTYMEVVNEDGTKTTVAVDSLGYNTDDYYDYSYSSRIRRFHTDVYAGWGYYDPYFTNMYWYDYAPASWGVSIYLGYNWWWPNYYYRPYYYDPYWYNCGFRYGWGWYAPYYGYYDPWYRPYGPCPYHGPVPIDYYHNHRDHNNSYFYGHRNNLGPSVGNGNGGHGGRPDKDNPNGYIAGGTGNGETNNHYSVSSSPASFNQRYDALAGATGAGSANGGNATTSATGRIQGKNPTQQTITNNGRATNNISRENMSVVKEPVSPSTPNSTARPATQAKMDAGTQATSTRPDAAGGTVSPASKPSQTVTRTVVSPSSSRTTTTTRPTTTTTRPATTTRTVTRTVTRPTSGATTPASSTRPASTSRPTTNSGHPSSASRPTSTSSSRSNYSEPARSSRPSHNESSSSRPNSRPNATTSSRPSSSSSSRSSFSSPSSSRSSSFSSSSSRGGGSSHSGGGYSGGGHSGGGGRR